MLRVFKAGTKPLSKGILRQRSKNGTLWLNKVCNCTEQLGCDVCNWSGRVQNYIEAIKWYRLAARQDSVRAQATLVGMYANGEGVVQDYAEAAGWYRLAAIEYCSVP